VSFFRLLDLLDLLEMLEAANFHFQLSIYNYQFTIINLQIDSILTANPLDCSRWQHLRCGLYAIARQSPLILPHPAVESRVSHPSRSCQFALVCRFHITSYFSAKLRKINDLCKKIFAYLFATFQKFSTLPPTVVPLHQN
jgi:hypothetical protein